MAGQRESGLVCDQQRNWDLGSSWMSWSSCRGGLHCRRLPGGSRVLQSWPGCVLRPAGECGRGDMTAEAYFAFP